MNVDLEKYRYFFTGNKIIAVSSYGGRTVRGYSKCDPRDTYDLVAGKELAAARCNEKIASKRLRRAATKMDESQAAVEAALAYHTKMCAYYSDAAKAYNEASFECESLASLH